MATIRYDIPKAPRWVSTEAGQWAWNEMSTWRKNAAKALGVQERVQLLQEAEQLSTKQRTAA